MQMTEFVMETCLLNVNFACEYRVIPFQDRTVNR